MTVRSPAGRLISTHHPPKRIMLVAPCVLVGFRPAPETITRIPNQAELTASALVR